uniref:Uncharacterized protein n=1 Tax=Cacopsylla melanoneura TaxID=428564 RepID=A0A8D8TG51_9HEMI
MFPVYSSFAWFHARLAFSLFLLHHQHDLHFLLLLWSFLIRSLLHVSLPSVNIRSRYARDKRLVLFLSLFCIFSLPLVLFLFCLVSLPLFLFFSLFCLGPLTYGKSIVHVVFQPVCVHWIVESVSVPVN